MAKITVDKSKQGKHAPTRAGDYLVVIGSDHGGYAMKQAVVKGLTASGYTVVDVGGFSAIIKDDYPDFAAEVAKAVVSDRRRHTLGVLICSSGTGMVMAANKVPGARAAFAFDNHSAVMARHDNDANILCLRGLNFPAATACKLAVTFMQTPFSQLSRHKRRITKIARIEKSARTARGK